MAYDIGTSLFVELLGMTQYPGQPFTGNVYRDLIMFFIVPTIFIIMVLYIMSGRIIPNRNFRVMLGVGAYLFIIAGGYYSFFALLAGPYFIFLIFILGVLGYLGSHFRPHRGGGGAYSRGGGHSREYHEGGGYSRPDLSEMSPVELDEEKEEVKDLRNALDKEIKEARGHAGKGNEPRIEDLIHERARLTAKLETIDDEKKILSKRKIRRKIGY